jgi:hypothetical protein
VISEFSLNCPLVRHEIIDLPWVFTSKAVSFDLPVNSILAFLNNSKKVVSILPASDSLNNSSSKLGTLVINPSVVTLIILALGIFEILCNVSLITDLIKAVIQENINGLEYLVPLILFVELVSVE